jgi:hypothetical protein
MLRELSQLIRAQGVPSDHTQIPTSSSLGLVLSNPYGVLKLSPRMVETATKNAESVMFSTRIMGAHYVKTFILKDFRKNGMSLALHRIYEVHLNVAHFPRTHSSESVELLPYFLEMR